VNLSKWIGLLALIATVYILWCIRHVLLLLLVAIVLATLLNRLTRWFLQFGVKRSVAVALSVAAFLVTAIGFAWMIIPPFLEQFQNLIALSPQILAEAQTGINWLQDQAPGKWSQDVRLLDLLVQQAQPLLGKVADSFVSLVSNLLAIALQPTCVLIPSGSALRLSLSAACFPAYAVNPGTGSSLIKSRLIDARVITLAIADHTRPSRLFLPILEDPI